MLIKRMIARVMKPLDDETGGGTGGGGGADFDIAGAVDTIGSDLFGSKVADDGLGNGETVNEEVVEPAKPAPTGDPAPAAPAAPAAPTAPAAPDPAKPAAPRTWRPEAIAEWEKLPSTVQAEITKREEDMFKGIEGYKTDAAVGKSFSQVLAPYQNLLAQSRQDPAQVTGQLFAAHAQLSLGSTEQKLATIQQIAKLYNVQLPAGEPEGEPAYVDPQVKALQTELAAVKSQLSGYGSQQAEIQRAEEARIRESLSKEIDTFAADPANTHFNEVANDIAQLLQSGVAKDLKDAYERAVWQNPVTRAKEVDRQTAEKTAKAQEEARKKAEEAAAATAANVRTRAKQAGGTAALGSIDDTLTAALANINRRKS